MTMSTESAYDRYVRERDQVEQEFRRNTNDYVYQPGGACHEVAVGIGHCDRSAPHYTHEALASNGNVLGRWRVRRQIERVDPNIQLPE